MRTNRANSVRIRGIVEPSIGLMSRERAGRWRIFVWLRPWRAFGGEIQTSSMHVWTSTRLPILWWWRMWLRRGSIVELSVDTADVDTVWGVDGRFRYLGRRIDEELREYQGSRPALDDKRFGRFTVDEDHNAFEVEADWLGRPVELMLGTNAWQQVPIDYARRIFQDAAKRDAAARALAVAELLPVAGEWHDGEAPLSADEFAAKMSRVPLKAIRIEAGGLLQFYFDGCDLFGGHLIVATFNERTGERSAGVST